MTDLDEDFEEDLGQGIEGFAPENESDEVIPAGDGIEEFDEQQIEGQREEEPRPSIKREFLSRHQQAGWNLLRELKKYPDFSNNQVRINTMNEYVGMPSLPLLNMKVLAAVIVFLSIVGENNFNATTLNSETFYNIANILQDQLQTDDIVNYYPKTKATFIRYAFSVLTYKRERR